MPTHRKLPILPAVLLFAVLLAACGGAETPTLTLPPTWTPTPYVSPTATPVPPTATATLPAPPAETPATDGVPLARLTVIAETAELRSGPGPDFEQIGTLNAGGEFVVVGRDESGGWWQILINKQPMWIAAAQSQVSNAETVALAQGDGTPITQLPTAESPTAEPPTPTPAPPTATQAPAATPRPRPTNTPAPTAAPDPCAGIGGDGCKFKLRGGPAFASNGGSELKLTLAFVHGGRNDEAQGSYFVWLEKDGVKLPVPDSVRSWTGNKRQGPNGTYNYEHKIGLSDLPGNTVTGCYTGWVLDGNGERDSQNFQFCVPDGQGEIWMRFDQS